MQYPLPEGHFTTPAPVVDQSMQVLVFQEPESKSNYTLIINRDRMEVGETPEAYCQRQIKTLMRQFTAFEVCEAVISLPIETPRRIPPACFRSRFEQDGTPVNQIQAVFQLDDTGKVLIFTLSSAAPFNMAQQKHLMDALCSFAATQPKPA